MTRIYRFEFPEQAGEPGTPAAPQTEGTPNAKNPASPKGGAKQLAGLAVAGYVGKQAIGFATSRVGQWTGSSQLQEGVNAGMKAAGYAAAVIANPALGLAAIGVDLATSMADYAFKRKWEDREIEQLRLRSGYYGVERSRE